MACYIGCTIIDLNPGVGLWSSKLHDVLKPKSHILVEPKQSAYLPFLKPLLDVPGTRYILRDWTGLDQWQSDSYISEGLIPKPESAIKPNGRNNSLLIVANLSYGLPKPSPKGTVTANLGILHYINQIRSNQNFQASGPVRMLMWMNDSDKMAILPRQIHHRRKLSVEIEMMCHVEEIVGGPASQIKIRREGYLDIESSKRVAKEMAKKNIQIPFYRQDGIQKKVQELLKTADGNRTAAVEKHMEAADTHRNWHNDLIQMEQAFRAGKFHGLIEEPLSGRPRPKPERDGKDSKQLRELRQLRLTFKAQKKHKDISDGFVQAQAGIESLESDIQNQTLNELQRQKKSNELKQLKETLKLQLESVPKAIREVFYSTYDNRKAFTQDPPLFMWDRRTAEPIIAQENEFWNPKTLALLDFEPRSPNHLPVALTRTDSFKLIMAALFANSSSTLYCLNSLAPGVAEAIAPNIPSLRDPRKGGLIDLSDLRVRCFTPKMVCEIAQAWENWPFKPTMTEMICNSFKKSKF